MAMKIVNFGNPDHMDDSAMSWGGVWLSLRVSGRPGLLRRRLDRYDFESPLLHLKEQLKDEMQLPTDHIDLVHHGRILDDEKSLKDSGVKPGEMLYVLKKYVPKKPAPPERITEFEIQECVSFFRSFKHPAETALTLLLKIRDQGHSESFLSAIPLLANDPVAINFLREPELLAHMGDPDTIRKIAEKHPALIEAVGKISGTVVKDGEKPSTGRCRFSATRILPPTESDDEADIDIMGDPDEEGDGSGTDSQHSGGGRITAEQLSSALALAGMVFNNSGTNYNNANNNSRSRSSNSSSSSSSETNMPGLREFLGSLLAADRPSSSSSPGSSRPLITTDMFTNALSQALNNPSGSTSTSDSSSIDPTLTPEEVVNARKYAAQLLKMQEMGLMDNRVNLRALIFSDGDVNAAINIVLSHL